MKRFKFIKIPINTTGISLDKIYTSTAGVWYDEHFYSRSCPFESRDGVFFYRGYVVAIDFNTYYNQIKEL